MKTRRDFLAMFGLAAIATQSSGQDEAPPDTRQMFVVENGFLRPVNQGFNSSNGESQRATAR